MTRDRQKKWTNMHQGLLEFETSDQVFLVPWIKSVVRFGKKEKLSPKYIEPFEIEDEA